MFDIFVSAAYAQQSIHSDLISGNASGWDLFIQALVQSVKNSGPFGKLILLILLFYSIISWAIIVNRFWVIGRAKKRSAHFVATFWSNKTKFSLPEYSSLTIKPSSPVEAVVHAAYQEMGEELSTPNPLVLESKVRNLERAVSRTMQQQVTHLEKYLSFLGTTASACPFWGLLGTVWGILSTFYAMGAAGTASITTIGPSLAEALIATAAGLTAAIPALIAYNYFVGQIKIIAREMEHVGSEFLSLVEK